MKAWALTGAVGQAAVADYPDGFGDDLADIFADAKRGHRERDQHETTLADQGVDVIGADADLLVVILAELDVVKGIERAVWLAVLVEPDQRPRHAERDQRCL